MTTCTHVWGVTTEADKWRYCRRCGRAEMIRQPGFWARAWRRIRQSNKE